jgi:Flp pilus assembly protein TadD
VGFRIRLSSGHHNLGIEPRETGRPAEAEAEYRAALAISQASVDEYSAVVEGRENLASTHYDLGILLAFAGRTSEAESEYRAAMTAYGRWSTRIPGIARRAPGSPMSTTTSAT